MTAPTKIQGKTSVKTSVKLHAESWHLKTFHPVGGKHCLYYYKIDTFNSF